MHDNLETVATPDVSQHAEHSVTLCPCGKPAKKKFCCGACRQKAHRNSPAHTDNLNRLRNARRARRADYYQRRNRSRALATVRGYSGPVADGVPRLGALKLENYLGEKALHE
jgi:CDGSH-type Zn-finger protein